MEQQAPAPEQHAAQHAPPPEYDAESVARWLLRKDYVLTALELYQETLEAGLAMPAVRDSLRGLLDPAQQAASAQAQEADECSPMPARLTAATRGASAVGIAAQAPPRRRADSSSSGGGGGGALTVALKEKDDRIALLEYELKVAREDVDDMMKKLKAKEKEKSAADKPAGPPAAVSKDAPPELDSETLRKPMTTEESRQLHQMVKQHLVANRLNLTAITFVEELRTVDPDWTPPDAAPTAGQAGAAKPPPELLAMFRQHVQRELYVPSGFKERLEGLTRECALLQTVSREREREASQLRTEKAAVEAKLEETRVALESAQAAASVAAATAAAHAAQAIAEAKKSRPFWAAKADATKASDQAVVAAATAAAATAAANAEAAASSAEATEGSAEAHEAQQAAESAAARAEGAHAAEGKSEERTWQGQFRVSRRERNSVGLRGRTTFESRLSQVLRRMAALEGDESATVRVLADCLPFVVPGVVLAKREELIPLFLCAARLHPDSDTRHALTRLFFNLIKKPDETQRAIIIEGIAALASLIGPSRTSSELIEECRQDVSAKHEERRVLVADACGALAPHTSPEVRESVLLSILLNMILDKNAVVRGAAVKNLAALTTYFSEASKFASVQDALGKLLRDPQDVVISSVRTRLFPAVVDWADVTGRLHTSLVPFLFSTVSSFLSQLKADGVELSSDEDGTRDENARFLELIFSCIESTTTQVADAVFLSVPNVTAPATVGVGGAMGADERATLRQQLEAALAACPQGTYPSDAVQWVGSALVPAAVDAALLMPGHGCLPMRALGGVVSSILRELGPTIATSIAQPVILSKIGAPETNADARSRLLVFYSAAVLPALPDDAVMRFARTVINDIALGQNGWSSVVHLDPLRVSFNILCSRATARQDALLPVLWELVVSPVSKVRICVASLLAAVVPALSPSDIGGRVVPGLASLHSDPDPEVRAAVCRAYAAVLVSPAEQTYIDKAAVSLESLAEDRVVSVRVALCRAFGGVTHELTHGTKTTLIERFILPKLSVMAASLGSLRTDQERAEVAAAVWEAIKRFQGISLSGAAVINYLVPGIKKILEAGPMLDPAVRQSAEAKLAQLESALRDVSGGAVPSSSPSSELESPRKPAAPLQQVPIGSMSTTAGAAAAPAASPSSAAVPTPQQAGKKLLVGLESMFSRPAKK